MNYLLSIIAITFTTQLFAQHIFSEINLDAPSIKMESLQTIVKQYARKPSAILSIGESHLQNDTALPIQMDLMNTFAFENRRFSLCAEHIASVVESKSFKKLEKKARKTIISHGNNPYKTDFVECNKRKRDSRIIYSGFFHQYPFAKYFPLQFAQTPVITNRGNNIWEQNNKKGLYITQTEMIHLESGVTRSILASPFHNFETNITKAKSKIEQLQRQMISLNNEDSIYKHKLGYITKSSALFAQEKALIPQDSYMIFTELAYRATGSHLHLLEKLQNIKSHFVESIFNLPSKQKYFVSSYQTLSKAPTKDDYTRYGSMSFKFELGSQFFHFKNKGFSVLLVSQPSAKQIDIFNAKTKKRADLSLLNQAL